MKAGNEKLILIAWGLVILFASIWILLEPLGWGPSDWATLEEFYIYTGEQGELALSHLKQIDHITQSELINSRLYVCGHITTDGRSTRLLILIRNKGLQLIQDIHKGYTAGYFCEELTDDQLTQTGIYKITVFHARDKIGEATLTVTRGD